MTREAFTNSSTNRNRHSDHYSTPSNSLACSWDNFDDNFEDEGLVPVLEESSEDSEDFEDSKTVFNENRPSNFSRSSSVKSNLVYGLFNCAKCKICSCSLVCWVQKRYETFKGKTVEVPEVKIDHDDVTESYYVTNEAIIRDKLEREDAKRDSGCHGDSSLSYSFNPHEDWSAADNLSWDHSADFLDSFRHAVPYRTIKYVSTPKRLDHQDWISIDEVDLLAPSAHSSPKTIKKSSPIINRVITTSMLTPTKQFPVQVTLKPPTPPRPQLATENNSNSTSGSSSRTATTGSRRHSREERRNSRRTAVGHRRIERLKEDVAQVRSQIGLALKLCEQVESELNEMKRDDAAVYGAQLVRPSQMKSVYRKIPDDCYVWGPLGPRVLRNGYHPSDFWTRQEPPNWLKKSAQHRVFIEEMKYHFKWQQFSH